MPSQKLFEVDTGFVKVTFTGPNKVRHRVGHEDATQPRWTILINGESDPGLNTGLDLHPFLYEDVQYKIRIKSLIPGAIPEVRHRDPLLVQDLDSFTDDQSISGPINFRRQVGFSRLDFRVGNQTLSLLLEVFPTKIDYATDFERVVKDISGASRALALEYLRATYRTGSLAKAQPTELEWVSLLREEIASLQKSVEYINAFPRKALVRGAQLQRTERVQASDSRARQSIVRRQGTGPWVETPHGRIREFVYAHQSLETLDTVEHRWIHQQLFLVATKLEQNVRSLDAEAEVKRKKRQKISERFQAERREICALVSSVHTLRGLPVFRSATANVVDTPPSLQLTSATGYGDAFRSLLVLRHGLDPTSLGTRQYSLSDIHELFEKWCFLEVIRIACTHYGVPENMRDLVTVTEKGIRVGLKPGKATRVRFSGQQKLEVSYNETFRGLTGSQRPDIVLRFMDAKQVPLVVILDAKYRVDAAEETVRAYGLPAPPQDAINALHRYRDAIVIDDTERGLIRPVVRGAALYPLSADDSKPFPTSKLSRALEVLGIGAIPFLPGNTKHLSNWLELVLSLARDELGIPGPPFAGVDFDIR